MVYQHAWLSETFLNTLPCHPEEIRPHVFMRANDEGICFQNFRPLRSRTPHLFESTGSRFRNSVQLSRRQLSFSRLQ